LANFDQLPTKGVSVAGQVPFGGNLVETPPVSARNFDQLVEDPSKNSEISGLRPENFGPSMSLRALL
jgi:hypothetical protein